MEDFSLHCLVSGLFEHTVQVIEVHLLLPPSVTECWFVLFKVWEKVSVQPLAALFCLSVSLPLRPSTNTHPPPASSRSACLLSWHSWVRPLQAACSFHHASPLGCHQTRWAPFNPISEISSDVGKERITSSFFFLPPFRFPRPVICQFPWK